MCCATLPGMMRMTRVLPLLILPLLIAGCMTPSITNLTATTQQRNASGLYPVEAAFQTRQQAMIKESIQPYVLVGHESFPMQPTPLVQNRWETLIPVPPDRNAVFYRFRFDYDFRAIPEVRKSSDLSPEYRLQIVD
jgi:hypothetical protein